MLNYYIQLPILFIKKKIKIILLKYFDFYFYNNSFLDVIKFYFTFNKKFFFKKKYITFRIKSFFVYYFFSNNADYERENIKLFEILSDEFNLFLDIGSNFGLYSMLFSSVEKNISYAIELNPKTYQQLKIITKKNKNIKIFNIGISNKNFTLDYPRYHPIKMSTKLNNKSFLDMGVKKIEIFTIDKFVEKEIINKGKNMNKSLVKIDIEVAEVKFFENSNFLIKKHKPFILLELHPKDMRPFEVNKILRYLKNNFYNIYDVERKFIEINIEEYNENRFLLCVPEDKINKFEKIKYKTKTLN